VTQPSVAPEEPAPRKAIDVRLHPLTILFGLGGELRNLAIPALLTIFAVRRTERPLLLQLAVILMLALIISVWRYFSFRMRYDESELVIRTGVFRRNERHIPYNRIQSVDSTRNAFHQMFGVVDVVIQTAGGNEPEAKLSVLPAAAIDEIRARVFGSRPAVTPPSATVDQATDAAGPVEVERKEILLQLRTRDLLLYGFIENRGMVLVLAAVGLFAELGPLDEMIEEAVSAEFGDRGPVRGFIAGLFSGDGLPMAIVLQAAVVIAALLIVARLVSVVWAAVRMYNFTVSRVGNDLRVEYGLFTRVAGTVPMHRIQTIAIRAGLAHRAFSRVTLNVTVARGSPGEGSGVREPLVPILAADRVPALMRELWPDLDLDQATWQPLHPRAHVRFLRGGIIGAVIISAILFPALRIWSLVPLALMILFQLLTVKRLADSINWTLSSRVFAVRRGWLSRRTSIAWLNKVQVVTLHESFFDRRTGMASVSAHTAGGASAVSFARREDAGSVFGNLVTVAASTRFRL
jgi:putative membrane protein